MVSVVVKTVLLVHLLQLIAEVACQSPCSNYFAYIKNETENEIYGYINIPSPPKGVSLQISVSLSIAAALPTKYVGRLELVHSKEMSVKRVMQGKPLAYKIHFPLRQPIPSLTGLWFNNQLLCSGPRVTGTTVTSITLNHTLYPAGTWSLAADQGTTIANRPSVQTTVQPLLWVPMLPVVTTTPETTTQQSNVGCGRPNNLNTVNPLIAGGTNISPGQWPWVVAIFIVKFEFEFQCGGSLVSDRHIITAAHCTKSDNVNVPAGTLMVSLGRYRLRDWREKGSLNREVAEYRLHPNYKTNGNADSDLAVLILRERVEYSPMIRPICLWIGSPQLEVVVGKVGTVIGWGRDELGNRHLEEPRMSEAPIVSQEVCLWSNEIFASVTSNRTFCAGLKDGTGPCNGDSGSGFVIYSPRTDRYYLRGVVSRSLLDNSSMSCDLKQYVIYVDVAKYLDWIQRQIST